MLYDVEQIAKLTKVSKVTVYRKLKLNEVKPYIITKQGKSFLDDQGFHVITELLNVTTDETEEIKPKEIEQDASIDKQGLLHETSCNNSVITELKDQVEFLRGLLENHPSRNEIEFLRNQIQEKDRQLESKDRLIENMQILVKNSQINQENDIPMLEAHFMELDEKLVDIRKEMDQKNDIQIMLEAHFLEFDEKLADIRKEMGQRKIRYEEEQQSKGFWSKLFKGRNL